MSEEETEFIHTWAKQLSQKYPQIDQIFLFGSRAYGTHRNDSDYDIIIILKSDEYGLPIDKVIGKQIGMDNEIHFTGLDLFVYAGADPIENYRTGGVMFCRSMSLEKVVCLKGRSE